MRSKNVKVFKNDDENYTNRVSATPVHYLTINGWKEIDNSLVLANNQFVISDSNYNVIIPAQLGLLPIDLSYFDLFSMKIFTINPNEKNFSAIVDTHSFETVRTFYDEKNSNLAVSSSFSFKNEKEIFSVQSSKFSLLTSVRELYFELENLSVLNDESVLKFIDENGFCIYSINIGFLELNGYKTVIEKLDGNIYSLSLIELNIDDSLQTETLIPIQLDIIQNINADSNDFQDKYVIEGSTNLYFGSYVRIGESEYGILDPFGQIYYPVYKGIYELNFPFPPNDWIVTNAELSVRKMEFLTLDTQLGYITSEIPYENINGVTSYTIKGLC